MYVAQPSVGVVLEKNVATVGVPAKSEALQGVLDLGREPQSYMVPPNIVLYARKVSRIVLQLVIEVEAVHIFPAHHMLRALGGNSPQLLACGFRVRQEKANYVGNVFI